MPEYNEGGEQQKEKGNFEVTSEEQLLNDYSVIVGTGSQTSSDEVKKAKTQQTVEEAKKRIRENGGLTRADRLELGIIGKGEAPDDFTM